MTKRRDWFDVDPDGLAQILEERGKAFALFELVQNVWDTDATHCAILLEAIPGRPEVRLVVEDNHPDGFADLTHAYTMFAPSEKKANPEKRGRLNLGEKLVLALCTQAEVVSTKGGVRFDREGRHALKKKRTVGSVFDATLRMTRAELEEVDEAMGRLLPPSACTTEYNSKALARPAAVKAFTATLPTVIADDEGNLRPTKRETSITLYESAFGGWLYEMGIPVVETGDRFHVDIGQKVPLNLQRDNVPPSYLQLVRTCVLNHTHEQLTAEDRNTPWVRAASDDKRCEPAAITKVLDLRFGEKRVAYDPSDLEANARATAAGYTVVHGGMLSKTEWQVAKGAGAVRPAGQVTPGRTVKFDPNGEPLDVLHPTDYTEGMCAVAAFTASLASALLDKYVDVTIARFPFGYQHAASYGGCELQFNLTKLGHKFFDRGVVDGTVELILHELAHDQVKAHLTDAFNDEVARLGVKLARLAAQGNPALDGWRSP